MDNSLTEIVFLLDRSGSMSGREDDTIGGFNGFVQKQADLGRTRLTTVLFDDRYEILYNGVPAEDIRLTGKEYFTRGSTALLDAVGKTINDVGRRLSDTAEEMRPGKVIFVITTDGLENSSREFTYRQVKEMIERQTKVYSWEFIFMGANIDAVEEGGRLGIARDRAFNYVSSTSMGVARMYENACCKVSALRTAPKRNVRLVKAAKEDAG
jgi:uncharacterized protein YegL